MQDLELEKLNKELTASLEHLATIQSTYSKLKECRKLGKLVNITDEDLRATRWALKRNGYSVESLDLLSLSTESGQLRYSQIDLALEGLGDALDKIWNKIKELFKKMFGWLFGKSKETPKTEPIKVPEIKIKVTTKKVDGSTTTSKYNLKEAEKGAKASLLSIAELKKKTDEMIKESKERVDAQFNTLAGYLSLKNTSTLFDYKDGYSLVSNIDEHGLKILRNGADNALRIIDNCLGGCGNSVFNNLLDRLDAGVLEALNKELKPTENISPETVNLEYVQQVKDKLCDFIESTHKFINVTVNKNLVHNYEDIDGIAGRLSGNFIAGFVPYKKDDLSYRRIHGFNDEKIYLYVPKLKEEHRQIDVEIELSINDVNNLNSKFNSIVKFHNDLAYSINNKREYLSKYVKEVEKKVNKLINDVKPLIDYPPNQYTQRAVRTYLKILQEISVYVTTCLNTSLNINNRYLLKMLKEIEQLFNIKK